MRVYTSIVACSKTDKIFVKCAHLCEYNNNNARRVTWLFYMQRRMTLNFHLWTPNCTNLCMYANNYCNIVYTFAYFFILETYYLHEIMLFCKTIKIVHLIAHLKLPFSFFFKKKLSLFVDASVSSIHLYVIFRIYVSAQNSHKMYRFMVFIFIHRDQSITNIKTNKLMY